MTAKAWKRGIHAMESGDTSYAAFNPTSNAIGKYQFVPRWWADKIIKFAKERGVEGVPSLKDMRDYSSSKMAGDEAKREFDFFIKNPKLQEEFMDYVYENIHTPQAMEVKKAVPNSGLDDEELKALVHFKGKRDAIRFLREGVDPTRSGNVSIKQYLNTFNKGRQAEELGEAPTFEAGELEENRFPSKKLGTTAPSPAQKTGPSQDVDYPDLTGRPFKEAFSEARSDLKSPHFKWNGKLYHTQTPEEVVAGISGKAKEEKVEPYLEKAPEPLREEKPAPGDMLGGEGWSQAPKYPVPNIMTSPAKGKVSDILKKTTDENYDKMGFGEAFAKAREKGKKEFTWKGKPYTTKYKEEL